MQHIKKKIVSSIHTHSHPPTLESSIPSSPHHHIFLIKYEFLLLQEYLGTSVIINTLPQSLYKQADVDYALKSLDK